MRTHRRGFLRMLGGVLALVGAPGPARARERTPGIHRATSNTLLGALAVRRPRFDSRPTDFKPYPGLPRTPLPAARRAPSRPLADVVRAFAPSSGFDEAAPLSLGQLARLLHFTNGATGRRDGRLLRAAPSAGALYAGEVYVVAERVEGLAPGIYSYAVAEHALVRVRPGAFAAEVERSLERPAQIAGAPALILLTNVFGRYAWRYGDRGYRFALIDTGHIGENLRLAARSAGLAESGLLRFHDDRLGELLGVDGREEAVCALHAVGRAAPARAGAPPPTRRFAEKQALDAFRPARGSLPERYHEATKLVPAGVPRDGADSPPAAPPAAVGTPGTDLPRPSPSPGASVEAAIAERRSAMAFRAEPLALEQLGFVLEMARGHATLERAAGLDLYLAAHRVRGLVPGLHHYEPDGHRLALVRTGDLASAMVAACLGQEMAGAAAAGCLMVARFPAGAPALGDRRYRDLCVESGAIGQRVYLAAEASGLTARNLAAFLDDDLNRVLGWDGRREAVLHLTMLGHE